MKRSFRIAKNARAKRGLVLDMTHVPPEYSDRAKRLESDINCQYRTLRQKGFTAKQAHERALRDYQGELDRLFELCDPEGYAKAVEEMEALEAAREIANEEVEDRQ